jgi:putative IMPACT (imprinted ancient) family translation regulator
VVRFFGGTKLGVPGLIEAYKTATEDAINNASIIEVEIKEEINLVTDYLSVNEVMRALKIFDAELVHQNYTDAEVEFKISAKISNKQELVNLLSKNYKIRFLEES